MRSRECLMAPPWVSATGCCVGLCVRSVALQGLYLKPALCKRSALRALVRAVHSGEGQANGQSGASASGLSDLHVTLQDHTGGEGPCRAAGHGARIAAARAGRGLVGGVMNREGRESEALLL